jgi:septal ring factor EnvC (AmiA/AmiB activator)
MLIYGHTYFKISFIWSYLLTFSSLVELADESILLPTCRHSFYQHKISTLQEKLLRLEQNKPAEWNEDSQIEDTIANMETDMARLEKQLEEKDKHIRNLEIRDEEQRAKLAKLKNELLQVQSITCPRY